MVVSIRRARAADADRVAELTAQLGYDVDPSTLKGRLSRILSLANQRFLIAEMDGRTVGWLHAAIWEYVETQPFVVIAGLVVDKAYRRQGIGRLLVEQAEAWTREQGLSVVRLWSSAGRTEAHRFYERLGYTNIKSQYSFAKSVNEAGPDAFKDFIPRIEQ